MALIACKSCGKMVSDRARACPACGTILIEETDAEEKATLCQECGAEIPVGLDTCPNCGCPIQVDDTSIKNEEPPQKVEVTAVNLPKIKQKTKKGIIIVIIAVAAIIVGSIIGIKVHQNKQKQEEARIAEENATAYETNLSLISFSMITGAAKAESAGNLIKSVWYDAIYEKWNVETYKYTQKDGTFVSDFNVALRNLFNDDSFSNTIDEIEENQELVAGYMKELKDPPEGYEDAFSAVKECYNSYLSFTNLVVNPSGSLQTFSSNFSDADSNFMKYYNALELYID